MAGEKDLKNEEDVTELEGSMKWLKKRLEVAESERRAKQEAAAESSQMVKRRNRPFQRFVDTRTIIDNWSAAHARGFTAPAETDGEPTANEEPPKASITRADSLLTFSYGQNLDRWRHDPVFINLTSTDGRFVLPGSAQLIGMCLHTVEPMNIPPFPDVRPDGRFKNQSSYQRVQQFILQILTHEQWTSWDGRPLAVAVPRPIIRFCENFAPPIANLHKAQSREELNGWLGPQDSNSSSKALVLLLEEIIWYHVCKLRKMEEQGAQAYARIGELHARWGVRPEEAQPAAVLDQNDNTASRSAIETTTIKRLKEKLKKRRNFPTPFGKRNDSATEEPKPGNDGTGTGGPNDSAQNKQPKAKRGLFSSGKKDPGSKPRQSGIASFMQLKWRSSSSSQGSASKKKG